MVRVSSGVKVVFVLFLVVSSSACIGKKKTQAAPSRYVTPCNVIGERVLVKADGSSISAGIIQSPLAQAFVDDILSQQAKDAWKSYTLSCWWAKNIGEKRGLYYCSGSYIVPDLDEKGIIRRYIQKNFKIGFDVESRAGVSFVIHGRTHTESPYFLLTVKEISANCIAS